MIERTRVFNMYYDYALHEAKPNTVLERRKEFKQSGFSEWKIETFETYWTLCIAAENLNEMPGIQKRILQKMHDMQHEGLDATRYWAYVNGKQSACYNRLLKAVNMQNCDHETLISLFQEAFVSLENFPYNPAKYL